MFNANKFVEETVNNLRAKVKGCAIIGISGGVDSTTAAILAHRAIGERLRCVLVDTGARVKQAPGFTILATSENCKIQALKHKKAFLWRSIPSRSQQHPKRRKNPEQLRQRRKG